MSAVAQPGGEAPLALVVGGSRGLGFAAARQLAERGHRLVLVSRNAEDLERGAALLRQQGAEVEVRPCDVRDADGIESLITEVEEQLGPIDVLLHVAGVIQVGPLASLSRDDFLEAIDVMLWGPINTSLVLAPLMVGRGRGRIGIITSVGGIIPAPHLLPYSTAKFGATGFARGLRSELAGTGVSVGVVPAGTGNLLARNLGVPLHLQAAVDVALHGQDRAIDLVAVSGDGIGPDEHFMVMAGMGFDAAVMEGANEAIKARVGWLAYVVSGFRNIMFPAVRIDVRVDGGEWTRHRARTVLVGNVGYLQAGMPLLPDAAIDDGVLDVVLLHPRRFLSWIPLAVRVLSRGKRTDELLNRMTGRTVTVRAATDTPRQLDGDPIGAGRELHAECVHGRLLVRVPR